MESVTADSAQDPAANAYAVPRGEAKVISVDGPVLELADGTQLVPGGDGRPSRIEDGSHVFTLADALRTDAEPFAGYVRR